ESDNGALPLKGWGFNGTDKAREVVAQIASLLNGLNADRISDHFDGADIQPSVRAGNIPAISPEVEMQRYFFVHHTPADTIDKISIAQIRDAFRARTLTCRALVEHYIRRIDAYDKAGPAINAIVLVNPDAVRVADDLDRRFAGGGPVGPLHRVPVIVKDNYETVDLPTTAGSLSLQGMKTGRDAFVVKRLRAAGALVLAKSNMAEFAFSQYETVSSILPGYTRNPYDTNRVTAG